jgi:hypothetical protein
MENCINSNKLQNIFFAQDKASYSKLLAVLQEFRALPVMGCQKTMSDFEKALISALEEAMPWAEVIYFFRSVFLCIVRYRIYLFSSLNLSKLICVNVRMGIASDILNLL